MTPNLYVLSTLLFLRISQIMEIGGPLVEVPYGTFKWRFRMSDQDDFRWDNAYNTAADFQVPAEADTQTSYGEHGSDSWDSSDFSWD